MSINLLPPETREDLTFARRNTILRQWITMVLLGIAGIGLVVVIGLTYISQSAAKVEKETEVAQKELENEKLRETQKEVEELSDSFNLLIKVLSKQVLFSKLLEQTGKVMPTGTSLTGLTINELEGGIDLNVIATNYQTASQVKVNLEDPENQLFETVDIISVTCDQDNSDPQYPCSGFYRALFKKDNNFMFLEPSGVATP